MMTTAPAFSFDPKTHTYLDDGGKPVISVTQVLVWNRCIDLDNIPGDTLEKKRELGDSVHKACHYLDQNDFDYSTMQPEWAPYIGAYLKFCEETNFKLDPEWIERSGVHTQNGMKYGYTIDRCGWIGNIPHKFIVELKCAYKPEPSWKLQTAAYELTVPRKSGEYIARAAVQLKPDETFKVHPYEDPRDKDQWIYQLAAAHWKLANGLKFNKQEEVV